MHRTIVVGGGIAGLAIAWQLARDRSVTLLEREPFVGTHSSARNAQIWLPIDDDLTTGPLAARTIALLEPLIGERAWLRRCEAIVIVPNHDDVAMMERGAIRGDLGTRRLDRAELRERSAVIDDRFDEPALSIDRAGIFDPNAMIGALERACKDAGVEIARNSGVNSIIADRRVRGIVLEDGSKIEADEIVIAAGAWSSTLAQGVGLNVPLVPLRRHLIVLEADPNRAGPIVWRFGESQVYWRPESGGVLASPCDEEPFDPCLPPSDPAALEALAIALEPIAPELVSARVRTKWACLRTYAHDRELVLGPDPRIEGLAWLAGFGGRGMTVAIGAAELCASIMRGEDHALASAMRPDRAYPDRLIPPHA